MYWQPLLFSLRNCIARKETVLCIFSLLFTDVFSSANSLSCDFILRNTGLFACITYHSLSSSIVSLIICKAFGISALRLSIVLLRIADISSTFIASITYKFFKAGSTFCGIDQSRINLDFSLVKKEGNTVYDSAEVLTITTSTSFAVSGKFS